MLLSHPTGNANVRHAALALAEAGLLEEFWTCVEWNPDSWKARLAPPRLRRELERRMFPAAVRARARSFPWREWGRLISSRVGLGVLARHERGVFSLDAIYQDLDRRVARRARTLGAAGLLRGVYAYEDGAEDSFAAARELGLARFYDLPIGYWRSAQAIYREEAARLPEWAATLDGIRDSEQKLARKEREITGASRILVASRFTEGTLATCPGERGPVDVIPYGAPDRGWADPAPPAAPGRLRAIFVGALTQRKGVSYLLEAVARLAPRVELTLVGARLDVPCAPLDAALRTHRWIPSLTHHEVLEEMRRHDVLVFPSLFEGFGLVILEALACGLPVIATPHTGGPDVLTEGEDGFVTPVRDVDALAGALETLLSSPARLAEMKAAALAKARALTWEKYRRGVERAVRAGLESQGTLC